MAFFITAGASLNELSLLPFAGGAACGICYALLKNKPVSALVLRGGSAVCGLVWVYFCAGGTDASADVLLTALSMGLLEAAGNLLGQRPDIQADSSAGLKTAAVSLGEAGSSVWAAALFLSALIFLTLITEQAAFIIIFAACPIFLKIFKADLLHKVFRSFIQPSVIFLTCFIYLDFGLKMILPVLAGINIFSAFMLALYSACQGRLAAAYEGKAAA